MGTLKTTIKVESSDLFPTPVGFTKINENLIAGNFSGFNMIEPAVGPATTQLNLADIDSSVYVYAEAPTTNVGNITIYNENAAGGDGPIQICTVAPGDVFFFHYLGTESLVASAANATDKLMYFLGERS
jgi:hypothetical protein